ncbi:MAG: hypothetical protein IT422_07035 [Pirellulaceae bacterium]|jgi:hypothetical protein|nr:hypothetical protein [Pirellulaceae bacterium]
MSAFKSCLLALTLGFIVSQTAMAQVDYIGYVEQLAAEAGQRAQYHEQEAIRLYRQQSGDWSTPDQQVIAYLVAESRRQNPGWYANLRQQEANFQQQQSQYVADRNQQMDSSFNAYMQRSQSEYQAHQDYVRGSIWERGLYAGDNGYVYELPYYQPYQSYEANDGSQFMQDGYGDYYQYDNYGWGTQMEAYGY